ncbi:MRX complex nuclease subunit [Martiniozyma asiatica (nom. inval.)]|nr:MRX complex nuclease subunit [Martiniozyma asiatica]
MVQLDHIDPSEDTFRILLTTDNHVGYLESDPIRGRDSHNTFTEILNVANEKEVDFILQAGDLFHTNNPSLTSYHHVAKVIRENCLGSKPIEYQLLSDPGESLSTNWPIEFDPNINVGLPIYAISGNHDDATGEDMLSPLDLLAEAGLLNHFGKVENEHITIHPLLFNKGNTNLALYGMGNVKEERLMKTMSNGDLTFLEPAEGDWFSIFALHQNHVHRPGVKVVEEGSLPPFLDFILWGHEHDIRKGVNDISDSFVLQGGSSVATSLSEGESGDKMIWLLSVRGKDFALESIKLKTVRPFVFSDVSLKANGVDYDQKSMLKWLIKQVEFLIAKANKKGNGDMLPLVRMRVDYSGGYDMENTRYFSNRFVGLVANINDVVTYHQKKRKQLTFSNSNNESIDKEIDDIEQNEENKPEEIVEMIKDEIGELIMLNKDTFATTLERYLHDGKGLGDYVKKEEKIYSDILDKLEITEVEDTVGLRKRLTTMTKQLGKQIQFAEQNT